MIIAKNAARKPRDTFASLSDIAQRAHLKKIVQTYLRAWRNQDPELIVTVFAPGARYIEGPKDRMTGLQQIADYWNRKVVRGQSHIRTKLSALHWDAKAHVATASWEALFVDTEQRLIKHMSEFALLSIDRNTGLITKLDERWSKWSPQSPATDQRVSTLSKLSFPQAVSAIRKRELH